MRNNYEVEKMQTFTDENTGDKTMLFHLLDDEKNRLKFSIEIPIALPAKELVAKFREAADEIERQNFNAN
jgi:hypothetical protein